MARAWATEVSALPSEAGLEHLFSKWDSQDEQQQIDHLET